MKNILLNFTIGTFTIMKIGILFFLILILLLTACKMTNKTIIGNGKETISKSAIVVTGIDSISLPLYDIVRFSNKSTNKKGIILNKKSSSDNYFIGQKINVKLCDVLQYSDVYIENDTSTIKNTTLIYGSQNKLKDGVDTINYRGDFMINAKIIINNKVVLDFGNDAIEPIFELCR
jgi:hypothetical protein